MPVCTFGVMYVSKDVYVQLLRARKELKSFSSGSIQIYKQAERGSKEEGRQKRRREERKGSARSQTHLSSSPFQRQQPELICDLFPSYKTMPRATVCLQRGANGKTDPPLADLLRT